MRGTSLLHSNKSKDHLTISYGFAGKAKMSLRASIMSLPSEKANREIDILVNQSGNDTCSECSQPDPAWASLEYGVFVCVHCSGIFRNMISNANLKAVKLEDWDDLNVQVMKENGNIKVNSIYEKAVPDCWVKPSPNCSLLFREQWIFAKYQRKEFAEARIPLSSYLTGDKSGMLFKLKKQGDKWQPRWFVLSNGILSMFLSREDTVAKHEIPAVQLNATINGTYSRMNAMQMITRMEGKTRNIFVYADSGREIVEWFCAIRAAKMSVIEAKHPGLPKEMIMPELSEDFIKTGYLLKTPPGTIKFQKRWFALDSRRLMYYNTNLDATPLGEIILGTAADKFSVDEEPMVGECSFTLHTPFRDFPLIAENNDEKMEWVKAFQMVFEKLEMMTPTSPRARCSTYELETKY